MHNSGGRQGTAPADGTPSERDVNNNDD
jgi:hypothetical protein